MKKLLVILMVVAMASFLFVGCLPSVTPEAEEEEVVEEEEEEVVVPTSATPVITNVQDSAGALIVSLTSTSTQYISKTEAGSLILIKGTAPSESLVTIYIDDVAVVGAVGETLVSGLWTVAVAESSLGDDGVKVFTAKVTELGLAESAASNSVTATLDTDLPGISSIAVTASVAGGTAADGTRASAIVTGANPVDDIVASASTTIAMVAGTWTISTSAATGTDNNVTITSSTYSGTKTYTLTGGETFTDVIPGVAFTFITLAAGNSATITTTASVLASTTAIVGRAKIVFDEDVSDAGMALGTYAGGTVSVDPTTYSPALDTGYWTGLTATASATATITVYGITDSAGNVGGTSAAPLSASCTIAAASTTALKP